MGLMSIAYAVVLCIVELTVGPAARASQWKGVLGYCVLGLGLAVFGIFLCRQLIARRRLGEYVAATDTDNAPERDAAVEGDTGSKRATIHLVGDAHQLMLVEQLVADNPKPSEFSPYISSGSMWLLHTTGYFGIAVLILLRDSALLPIMMIPAVVGIVGFGLVSRWIRRTRISLEDGAVAIHTLESDLKHDHRQLQLGESDVYADFSRMDLCVDDHRTAPASFGLFGYNRPHALVASVLSHRAISKSALRQAIAAACLKNPKPKRVA